jgi:Rrf2 family iron-sulfur cluster assembly transcriptional regulator
MLSATSQYALRALTELATMPEGEALLGRELAERCFVPSHYLTQIFVTLRNAGLVAAARGRNGGYHLAKPSRDVRLAEVIELFEGSKEAPHCFLYGDRPCGGGLDPCPAHAAWEEVQTAFSRFLKTTTLAELVPGGKGAEGPAVADFIGHRQRRIS